ncbi:MAG: ferredoxin, partial [Christensenellales bacterium]
NNPAKPEMADIGIFASVDPVALDQCCYDTIINSKDNGKESLVNRMHEKHAILTVEEACNLGLGDRTYELIEI